MKPTIFMGSLWTLMFLSHLSTGCGSGHEAQIPTHPVTIRIGADLTGDATAPYQIEFSNFSLCVGDMELYGMDAALAGYAVTADGPAHLMKHAGHQQGSADRQVSIDGPFALDLMGQPVTLAVVDAPEGHYFDGKLHLLACPPVSNDESGAAGSEARILSGHTLVVEGRARRDDVVYTFEIVLDEEVLVKGIEYAATVGKTNDMVVTTTIQMGRILQGIDFAGLANAERQVAIGPGYQNGAYAWLVARLSNPAWYRHEEMEPVPVH